jgi:hypothetical protein
MTKIHLLGAACAFALLGATPVFAQNSTGKDTTAATPATGSSAPGTMPADNHGAMGGSHPAHHSAMEEHHAKHASRGADAQDAAVNKLNDESYAAAQKGEAFGSGDASAPPPSAAPAAPGKL